MVAGYLRKESEAQVRVDLNVESINQCLKMIIALKSLWGHSTLLPFWFSCVPLECL